MHVYNYTAITEPDTSHIDTNAEDEENLGASASQEHLDDSGKVSAGSIGLEYSVENGNQSSAGVAHSPGLQSPAKADEGEI